MSKLDEFKKRAAAHGQDVTIHGFVSAPAGDYVDPYSGHPDPDDPDYPAAIPEPTYATAVTVKGFVQPARAQDGGERFVVASWGEEVKVAKVAYVPGDQAVGHRDKIITGGTTYWVAGLGEHDDQDATVMRRVDLTESVPNG
ncbi:MAG: hypothetical protein JW940_27310 [Polyangiaceae bacterium]|nr:hypothetical protein [Polyangiaceae bacterium]